MIASYTISDLAKEFDITTRTIRHYEAEGLLSPRRQGTNRIFSVRDRARLKFALRGQRLGIPLAELRELFDHYDVSSDDRQQLQEFAAKLERRRRLLQQQRDDIDVLLKEFVFFENHCAGRVKIDSDGPEGTGNLNRQ